MRPMLRRGTRLFAAAMLVAGFATAAYADDWLQWRGPDRAGISTETGLLDEWPPEGPAVNWQIETLGQGYGAVVVQGAAVYVQGTRGGESAVFRLRASDGGEVWVRELGRLYVHPDKGDGPRSAPTIHGDSLSVPRSPASTSRPARSTGGPGASARARW